MTGAAERHPERPIFILGCPRSGTTLLRVMLNAHPRIAIPPETRFLIPAYLRRRRFGTLCDAANRRRLADFVVTRPDSRFRRLRVPAEEAKAEITAAPPTLGSCLAAPFDAYARSRGKQRWGDKRPFYYSFVDELDRLFPEAQFVHVVRDGRACTASLKRPPFGYDSHRAMVTWLNAVHSCRKSGDRLGPERYHEVRYEDLVAEPESQLRDLCTFLGEVFDRSMLAPEEVVDQVVPSGFEQHGQIKAGVNQASVAKWRQELTSREVATLEAAGGDWLRALGYALTGDGRAPRSGVLRVRFRHRRYVRNLASWRRREAELHHGEPPVAAVGRGQSVDVGRPAPPQRSRAVAVSRRLTAPVRRTMKRARRAVHNRRRASLL